MRIHNLLSPPDLTRIARLQLLARQVVEGFAAGQHRSHHKGFSVEFKEHRPYVRGDELRSIDWKVFGKSDRLYIRQSEVDTNVRCSLLVDGSGSMAYRGRRSNGLSKFEYAQRLAAALAYLMLSQQDAVGIVTFDDRIRQQVPCRSQASHLGPLLAALTQDPPGRETDIGRVVREIAPKLGRRRLVILVSDAMADVESIGRALGRLRSAKHELLFFQILDLDETDFPFSGRVQFNNLELPSDQRVVDATPLRKRYRERFERHQAELRRVCLQSHVDWISWTTDRPVADALHRYVAFRARSQRS